MKTFEVKEVGLRFQHSKKWTPKHEKNEKNHQIHLISPNQTKETSFGIVIVEKLESEFTMEGYLQKGMDDLKLIEQSTKLKIQNIQSNKIKFVENEAAILEYELVDENGDVFSVWAIILLRNNSGYVFQISGPKKTFEIQRLKTIYDTTEFF
jgi:hypothetical protein